MNVAKFKVLRLFVFCFVFDVFLGTIKTYRLEPHGDEAVNGESL